ncbi:MAG: hypothetical protein GY839_20055 [candidate division Zixibacteria bacterium]|nr:hypothetical protein [candidate division Zixibacteria bacterium]
MINKLDNYTAYKRAINELRYKVSDLNEFSARLKQESHLKNLRCGARKELQTLYDNLSQDLDVIQLPVYLPARKKIYVSGAAYHTGGVPSEIRIYSIKGCSNKPYDKWIPKDVRACSEPEIFETFVHESAHVLEATRTGRMGHGKPFIKAYENIEEYFLNQGLEQLIDPEIRLTGIPRKATRR